MTKKEFIEKWKIDSTSIYHYVKLFPEIREEKKINYIKLTEIIESKKQIVEKTKKLMKNRKPKEIESLFVGSRAKEQSHIFLKRLYAEKKQILPKPSLLSRCEKIIKHLESKD